MFEFQILKKSSTSKARIGVFTTPHGSISTPVFMPVGTVGAVKTMTPANLDEVGAQIILANTYHLYLRPGDKLIKGLGGLHGFAKRNKPFLTDSGGFQVFSLGKAIENKNELKLKPAKITDDGVTFYSHLDGSKHFISPEKSIEIQENLGADIIMAFDECPPADCSIIDLERAVNRTHQWLVRCIKAKTRTDQALFPICQGGTDKELRQESAKFINNLDLPGLAIGGVSVGESKEKIYEVADWCTDILDKNRPRYLMGIGYPEDILEVIKLGIDMFDCVLPTRLARHGSVWIKTKLNAKNSIALKELGYGYEQIDLKRAKFASDSQPLDNSCDCYSCKTRFSKSYIRHLISEREPLGIHLATTHNLRFVFNLVEDIKSLIANQEL